MKIYQPNREERAFLYQEAQDLEPLVKDLGSLSVMIEEIAPKLKASTPKPTQKRQKLSSKDLHYRVTFMVAPESVGMRVQATATNLYQATIAAKEETVRQLNAIVNALPRSAQQSAEESKIPPELLH